MFEEDPWLMKPAERVREIGEILAAGFLRLKCPARRELAMSSPVTSQPFGRKVGAETPQLTAHSMPTDIRDRRHIKDSGQKQLDVHGSRAFMEQGAKDAQPTFIGGSI